METKRDYFKSLTCDHSFTYNLEKFANLRGCTSMDELFEIMKKRTKLEDDIEKMNAIEEKLIQKIR